MTYVVAGVSVVLFLILKNKLTIYKKELDSKISKIDELQKTIATQEMTITNLKPKIYTEDELASMKKYGDDFERRVGRAYEEKGYEVKYRGLDLGHKDQGIDLVATKGKEIVLLQCKYWKQKDSITHTNVKEFYGSCSFYIDKNGLDRSSVTCVYAIVEQASVHKSAYLLFQSNYIKCRYELFAS